MNDPVFIEYRDSGICVASMRGLPEVTIPFWLASYIKELQREVLNGCR